VKDDLLLLLESMYLPERRHCLPDFINSIENQQDERASVIFNEQIEFLSELIGIEMNIVRDTTGEDVGDFMWLLKKSKRTLLGRLRLIEAREARKVQANEEKIARNEKFIALSRRKVQAGKGVKSISPCCEDILDL